MDKKDFADMVRLARRAPLQNMNEAELAAALLKRFATFATSWLQEQESKKDADNTEL